jgi:uncharacterized damage-inducible protein DinB
MNLEPWLRSPLPEIVDELQPVAAMFIAAKEDILRAVEGLDHEQLWQKSNGAASIGFHMIHLAGATDRLMSYAEGAVLTDAQKADLAAERDADEQRPSLDVLTEKLARALDHAVIRLEGITSDDLATARELGRAKVPTTMRALILHTGEHASRHAGQIVTTIKITVHRA